jgi:hypothetical protein
MDIRQHLGVLSRWRRLVVAGVVLAIALAVLISFKVGPGGLEWRSEASFQSDSRTFVTQPGFPWGRATLPGADPTQQIAPNGEKLRTFAPTDRFIELAVVYAYLAQSEDVRRRITPAPLEEQIQVFPIPSPATGEPLPLLQISTTASSAADSRELHAAVIKALRAYLERNVDVNGVPDEDRVKLDVLNPPSDGVLIGGRSLTQSGLVFLLILAATLVAVYVLENLYPRRGQTAPADPLEELDFELGREDAWEPVGPAPGSSRSS